MSALARYLDACARIVHPDTDKDARDMADVEADFSWRHLSTEERSSICVFAYALRAQEQADHRAALVRMVVAEQWGVAIALCDPLLWSIGESSIEWPGVRRFLRIPCAVDVVAERLGER